MTEEQTRVYTFPSTTATLTGEQGLPWHDVYAESDFAPIVPGRLGRPLRRVRTWHWYPPLPASAASASISIVIGEEVARASRRARKSAKTMDRLRTAAGALIVLTLSIASIIAFIKSDISVVNPNLALLILIASAGLLLTAMVSEIEARRAP